ncbi:hypothetical protein BJ912DRAFT_1082436 [Pholiota molesta]|nr:hypothetical protein BJ912DRAFT_1082436 [Pholiota molesta]
MPMLSRQDLVHAIWTSDSEDACQPETASQQSQPIAGPSHVFPPAAPRTLAKAIHNPSQPPPSSCCAHIAPPPRLLAELDEYTPRVQRGGTDSGTWLRAGVAGGGGNSRKGTAMGIGPPPRANRSRRRRRLSHNNTARFSSPKQLEALVDLVEPPHRPRTRRRRHPRHHPLFSIDDQPKHFLVLPPLPLKLPLAQARRLPRRRAHPEPIHALCATPGGGASRRRARGAHREDQAAEGGCSSRSWGVCGKGGLGRVKDARRMTRRGRPGNTDRSASRCRRSGVDVEYLFPMYRARRAQCMGFLTRFWSTVKLAWFCSRH